MTCKKSLLTLIAVLMLGMSVTPADAQYHRHRRHRRCYWRHHHRVCRYY